jgi:hypothetical protein
MVATLDPQGNVRIGSFSAVNGFDVFDDTETLLGSVTSTPTKFVSPWNTGDGIFYNSSPCVGGGVWVGATHNYNASGQTHLHLWRGGYFEGSTTGTFTFARGATSVTMTGGTVANSWVGGFLFDTSNNYVGVIQAVNVGGNSFTLESPALVGITATTGNIRATRGFIPRYGGGTISITSGSTTATAVGTPGDNPAFLSQGIDTNYSLFRARDYTFVAQVNASVTSDYILTTTAASVTMDNEQYFLIKVTGGSQSDRKLVGDTAGTLNTATTEGAARSLNSAVGFITASYAYRQWYANLPVTQTPMGDYSLRIWFSSLLGPEVVDTTAKSGNFLDLPHTTGASKSIRSLVTTRAGLVIFTEFDVWIITGDDPTNFVISKVADDGASMGASAVSYHGGCFWAGRLGIYWFDGTSVNNISKDTLGLWYNQSVSAMNISGSTSHRVYTGIMRDHLLVHLTPITPPNAIQKGSVSAVPATTTVLYNITAGAYSLLTNVGIRAIVQIPNSNVPWMQCVCSTPAIGLVGTGSTTTNIILQDSTPLITGQIFVGQAISAGTLNAPTSRGTGTISAINTATNSFTVSALSTAPVNAEYIFVSGVTTTTTGSTRVFRGNAIFDNEGNDTVACLRPNTTTLNPTQDFAGPDFYLETKHYSMGDPLRKKLWKNLLMHYYVTGDTMKVDLVTGMNEPGSTNSSQFATSGSTWTFIAASFNTWSALSTAYLNWAAVANNVWLKKKLRFLKRDQILGFRIYQNSASVTKLRLGSWQLGFKYLRAGRI